MEIQKDLLDQIVRHEGKRPEVYDDATGKPIRPGTFVKGYPTIGVGRNLVRGLSDDEILYLLKNDMEISKQEVERTFPWYHKISWIRKRVILDLHHARGLPNMLKWKPFLRHCEEEKFDLAADFILKSAWAQVVGQRAKRLAFMMRNDGEPTW